MRLASLAHVNQSAILGESGTGYEDPEGMGEFECENCHYYEIGARACSQKDMMKHSKRKRTKQGWVKVDPEGCCEFVDRVGRMDED